MKVFVTRSSGWTGEGEVREYESLESCIKTLFEKENFGRFEPEVVVSRVNSLVPDYGKDCEYMIEIYDDWRE